MKQKKGNKKPLIHLKANDYLSVELVKNDLQLKKQFVSLVNTISPGKFISLANWLDKIDKEKGETSNEVQRDLRKFADLMNKIILGLTKNETKK